MSDRPIQVDDRVEWEHHFANGTKRVRTGTVVKLLGQMCQVRPKGSDKLTLVAVEGMIRLHPARKTKGSTG